MIARVRPLLVASLVAVAIALDARATAPPGQYELFNRTDKCIADHWTGLTWTRAPLAQTATFDGAATACAQLGAGWRVPSMKELMTLADDDPHDEFVDGKLVPKAIDANAFPRTPVDLPYWTSSTIANDTRAWAIDFTDGANLGEPRTVPLYVRCVQVTPATSPPACQ